MAVSVFNWVLLVLSLITAIVGSALLWRVYDAIDASVIKNPLQRLAQYESCGFVFFFIVNAITLYFLNQGKTVNVLRVLSIGILLFITVYGDYVNFNNLNNLRIVDMSSTQTYLMPNTSAAVDSTNQHKLLGGLIIGYFSLFFGLLSTITGEVKFNFNKISLVFWVLALVLGVTGDVVCWSNNDAPLYKSGTNNAQADVFVITTITLVEFVVLTLGLLSNAEDLLSASAFIFGVGGLFFPVQYFAIQYYSPNDADFLWAGPILCWIATFCMAVSAIAGAATPAKKEADV